MGLPEHTHTEKRQGVRLSRQPTIGHMHIVNNNCSGVETKGLNVGLVKWVENELLSKAYQVKDKSFLEHSRPD